MLKTDTGICDLCLSLDKKFRVYDKDDKDRKIYFISDVPHLIKTTRNNLENSHGNTNTRNLHVCTYCVEE